MITQDFQITDAARALAAQVPEPLVKRLHFAVDADRTLTRSDRTVSPAMQAAIQAVFAAGGQLHLCTGRQYAVLFDSLLKFFPAAAHHVVAGGSTIITTQGETLWEHSMPGKLVWQLIQQAQLNHCRYAFGLGKTIFTSSHMQEHLRKSYGSAIPFGDTTQLETVLENQTVLALFIGDLNPAMHRILQQFTDQISYIEMANYEGNLYVDVSAKGVNKATGLAEFAKLHNVPLSEIITVGDEANDLEMIRAGWGVAMGNAIPELKTQAKLIIDHTDNDGLAQFVLALIERRQQLS